jgi:hypothetical protein
MLGVFRVKDAAVGGRGDLAKPCAVQIEQRGRGVTEFSSESQVFYSSTNAEPHVPRSAKFNSGQAERSEERSNPKHRTKSCRFKIDCRRNQHSRHKNQQNDCDRDLEVPMHRSNYTRSPIRFTAVDFRAAKNLDNL